MRHLNHNNLSYNTPNSHFTNIRSQMRRTQRNDKTIVEHGTASGTSRERNNRRTTAMNDMSILGNMRRIQSPRRTSMMPLPSQLDITRRNEVEGSSNEMPLLYDKYLQTLMTEHVMKKKETERQKMILTQLASLEKKSEECDMKLHEIKMRMNDLEPLNEIQKYLDSEIQEIQTFLVASQSKIIEILDKIYSNLKFLDKLACTNIIIPKTTADLMIMHNSLDKCNQLLDSISQVMGDHCTEMISTNDNLKKFREFISVAEKLMKEMNNNLEHVQIEILKKGSDTMSAISV